MISKYEKFMLVTHCGDDSQTSIICSQCLKSAAISDKQTVFCYVDAELPCEFCEDID
jgi:hypothetical protein